MHYEQRPTWHHDPKLERFFVDRYVLTLSYSTQLLFFVYSPSPQLLEHFLQRKREFASRVSRARGDRRHRNDTSCALSPLRTHFIFEAVRSIIRCAYCTVYINTGLLHLLVYYIRRIPYVKIYQDAGDADGLNMAVRRDLVLFVTTIRVQPLLLVLGLVDTHTAGEPLENQSIQTPMFPHLRLFCIYMRR